MNEEDQIAEFIKTRLEADIPAEPPHLEAIIDEASRSATGKSVAGRMHSGIWGGLLVAAALVAICLFAVHQQNYSPLPKIDEPEENSQYTVVADMIDLLRVAAGYEPVATDAHTEESVVDIMLAWQDAPYEHAISGLLEH